MIELFIVAVALIAMGILLFLKQINLKGDF